MRHHLLVVAFLLHLHHVLLLHLLHDPLLVLRTQMLEIWYLSLEHLLLLLLIEFHLRLAHHLLLLSIHLGLGSHRLLLLHGLLLLGSFWLSFKLLRLAWGFLSSRFHLLLLFLFAVHFYSFKP